MQVHDFPQQRCKDLKSNIVSLKSLITYLAIMVNILTIYINAQIAMELKITPIFGQITGIREKLDKIHK